MRKGILLSGAISLTLAGCGGDDSSNSPSTPAIDNPILITSVAPVAAIEDQTYQYQLTTNLDSVTFSAHDLAVGMALNEDGLLTWTPLEGQTTSGMIELIATDKAQSINQTTQRFTIDVTSINDAPQFKPLSELYVRMGEQLTYPLEVFDPDDANDGENLTFTIVSGPEGLTITTQGVLTFTSEQSATTDHQVTVQVVDGQEDGAMPDTISFTLTETSFVRYEGSVKNYYNHQYVDNAHVTLHHNGQAIDATITDTQGQFTVEIADQQFDSTKPLLFGVNAREFTPNQMLIAADELNDNVELMVAPVHSELHFHSNLDAHFQVGNRTIVEVPANALVDSNGVLLEGELSAEILAFNPALDIHLLPGELLGEGSDGSEMPLQSFGAISVEVFANEKEMAYLAPNTKATIRIPAASSNPPLSLPLYQYQLDQGHWLERGVANLSEGFYVADVSDFGIWSVNQAYQTITLSGCVVDVFDQPVNNAKVGAYGVVGNSESTGYTDQNGQFAISVPANSNLLISAIDKWQSRTSELTTAEVDLSLTNCLVVGESFSKIELKWGAEPSDLDSHLYGPDITEPTGRFHIWFGGDSHTIGDQVIYLDVDDTTSFGPEIITIPEFSQAGFYRYAVHNFSRTPDMRAEETQVRFTINGQPYTFIPPSGQAKLWWHVFEIYVDESLTPHVLPINEWSSKDPDTASGVIGSPALHNLPINTQAELITLELLSNKYYAQ